MNNGQTYELGFLALSTLSAKDVEALQTTLTETVGSVGGQVASHGDVHFIDLAYEMVKKVGSKNTRHDQAYFSWIKFTIEAASVNALDAQIKKQDSVLRYILLKTDSDDSLTDVFSAELEEGEEEVKEEVKETSEKEDASVEVEEKTETVASDDLTKIEGIGPVIATTLTNAGIGTYANLADASADSVMEIITGVRGNHDPATWAQQATLARDGKWDELKTLQDELDGGKEV